MESNNDEDANDHPEIFKMINRMWKQFGAELWSFDPSVDPAYLKNFNQFGTWIFVIRNKSRQHDRVWFQAHKETLSIDPGFKTFETIYNVGTGDIFMIGHGLGQQLKISSFRIASLQSKMDGIINEDERVVELKEKWEVASLMVYRTVLSFDLSNTTVDSRVHERQEES